MDAITLLRNDHKTVDQLFKRFEKAGDGQRDEKRRLVDRMIEELSMHAAIEEQLFYPVARSTVPGTEDMALESLEEHHVVKWLLSELESMDPSHERFDAKVTVLIENVRHHVEEEERDFFPKVRDALGRRTLTELGDALEAAKAGAPTHPHPRSPDTPPGNSVIDTIAGVVDRVGDNLSGIAQGGVSAAQDFIARVLGNDSNASAPTGSSIARSRATGVRRQAASATGATTKRAPTKRAPAKTAAKKAAAPAKTAAKKAAAPAKTAAKKATAPAKTAAKRAAGTAKRTTRAAATTTKRASGTSKQTSRAAGSTAKRATGAAKQTTRAASSTAKRASSTAKKTARS